MLSRLPFSSIVLNRYGGIKGDAAVWLTGEPILLWLTFGRRWSKSAPDIDLIRNPKQYLYAVASNLAKAQRALDSRRAQEVAPEEPAIQQQLAQDISFDAEFDTAQRLSRLREVIAQLPPKCRVAVLLQYRYELKYAQIGERLGVSAHSVKKYLSRAIIHCRRRMAKYG